MSDIPEEEDRMLLSRERGFFDKNKGLRILILLILAGCVFIFLHFREVRIETLELNSYSKRYVIAPVDFDFPDEEATIIKRQKGIRDIANIYRIDVENLRTFRQHLDNRFLKNTNWRQLTHASLDEMHHVIDLLEEALYNARFTNVQTINKMKDVDYLYQNYYPFLPEHQQVIMPAPIWEELKVKAFSGQELKPELTAFILDRFQDTSWLFVEDNHAEINFKKFVQNNIPEKYTTVKLGRHVIDHGEKVTSRHIAMMQAMKEALSRSRNLWNPLAVAGSLLMTVLFIVMGWLYFRFNHPDILLSNRKLALLITIVILTLAIAKLTEAFLIMNDSNLIEDINYPLFVPFGAILISTLMNHRIAVFVSGFLAVIMSMSLAVNRMEFLLINLTAAVIVILGTRTLHRRKEIFWIMGKAWFGAIIVIIAFHFSDNHFWETSLTHGVISTFIFLLITAILVVGLLPVLESTFHVLTDMILMEYMDPNNELLRRLAIEAPGTYQHSMVVGHLAEAGARTIGANSLFCRVSSLYHDVGKLSNPQYFTENQQRGIDMHQLLTPLESAQVIIAHVSDGVIMARKEGLPESFVEIIKEHHGTTLVYYFYCKQREMLERKEEIEEKVFRYAGPKPRSKESAIIMIADTLEAASRSLDEFSEETITELIDKIIQQKAKDGQFNECLLTFEELGLVRMSMINTLVAATHSRIKYPKQDSHSETIS